jgi:MFS superfamily sulfate permease-like transporter
MMTQASVSTLPKTGLAGLKENWRYDLQSGFLVFLIGLPLCLGISVASGFPPSAGIITAIIGGLLVSRLNGSFLTINGPAAGLIVVVLSAVQTLGAGDASAGYRYTLAAIVVASLIQLLMGFFKLGQLSAFFPASVVHGMLAAIGIIIMVTQSHVMLGTIPEAGNLFAIIAQIPHSLATLHLDVALISFLALLILIIWPLMNSKIPAAIIVLLVGALFAWHFDFDNSAVHNDLNYLVVLPDQFMASFAFPDFSKILSLDFWVAVLSISLVGSIESLLAITAIDQLDPYQRTSDVDKDLTAIGIGNLIAGLLGGLPMIAEIVRSSANISYGARSAWSNFFHGLLLLLFVVFFTGFIQRIPLAALAALLVFIGYSLASPSTFSRVKDIGNEQLFIFLITIVSTLATNLLLGVILGTLTKLIISLARGVLPSNLFKIHFTIQASDQDTQLIKLSGSALFSNVLQLKKVLHQLALGQKLIIDLSNAYLIDHSAMSFLQQFQHHYESKGGHCQIIGIALTTFSDHALAGRLMTADDRK